MCVGFWAFDHGDYALLLCTNRDEFLARPTTQADFHSFGHESDPDIGDGTILSGRDLQAGGTWMGINRDGKLALLTNITEPAAKWTSSRGHVVSSYLMSPHSHTLDDELQRLASEDGDFAGFNLFLACPSHRKGQSLSLDAGLVTNHGGGGTITTRILSDTEKRCGGMSNGVDGRGDPEWPRVTHGRQNLMDVLASLPPQVNESDLVEHLFELLSWKSREPVRHRSELRNTIQIPPMMIPEGDTPTSDKALYGTRLSTVILIRKDGQATFVERDIYKLDTMGEPVKAGASTQRIFRFQLRASEVT
ncbi:hypothetical protein JAAARDRAFT_30726 [Jaapia argillacea MUCL 33604]|uniref:DUF833-domain-containing protein n=1 Tax=Jaapia argillacea MUCL 33604 TaxID=933084 RepID=A0A067QJM6_9AGAM|nr:hypothetical protein JAAARDRAFT_30726 [Jaapia argillacea MUCL 33604]